MNHEGLWCSQKKVQLLYMLFQSSEDGLAPAEPASLHTYTWSLSFSPFLLTRLLPTTAPLHMIFPLPGIFSFLSLPSRLLPSPNVPSLGKVLFPGQLLLEVSMAAGTSLSCLHYSYSFVLDWLLINVHLLVLLEGRKWVCSPLCSQHLGQRLAPRRVMS